MRSTYPLTVTSTSLCIKLVHGLICLQLTRFGVRLPRTLDYSTINLNPGYRALYDHNVCPSKTDRRTDGRTSWQ